MRTAWRTVAIVAAVCLAAVLVAWAALIGPQQVFTGPGPRPSTVTTTPTAESAEQRDEVREQAEDLARRADPPMWLTVIVWFLEAVVLLGMMAFLVWVARRLQEQLSSRPRRRRAEEREFDVLDEPARIERAVREDAHDQERLLIEGSPRNAIVACWQRFEVQAGRAGMSRHEWETSSEFTLRMLDRVGVDAGALSLLAGLYREARFSDHELGEADRERALEALRTIHAGMGARP